jgi:uncharacterized protein (DUF2141 family)
MKATYSIECVAQQIAEATKALAVIAQYNLGVKQASAVRHAESVLNAASLTIERIQRIQAETEQTPVIEKTEASNTAEVTEEALTPMRRTEKQYSIEVSGYHAGNHNVRVVSDRDGSKYVSGSPFGCSRNYFVSTDREAINRLMVEHGCSLVDMTQV